MAGGTVRVKMLTSVAGRPAYSSNDIVDLKPEIAKAWIEEGYCTPVREEAVERAGARG